jgi:hypothetical protein
MQKKTSPAVSLNIIIETIQLLRNHRINELLRNDQALLKFLEKHYGTEDLSATKREFLKRDLSILKSSKLNELHYAPLIREIQEKGGTELVHSHTLFNLELGEIFKKYAD